MAMEFDSRWEYHEPDPEILEAMACPRHAVRIRGEFTEDMGFTRPTAGLRSRSVFWECADAFAWMWNAGVPCLELIAMFEVDRLTIRAWRKKLRLQKRDRPTWTPRRLAAVRRCHEEGMSAEEGAAALGISIHVYRLARLRAGVRLRAHQRPSLAHLPTHLRPDVM